MFEDALALLVGINNFPNKRTGSVFKVLPGASADALLMKNALELVGYKKDNVRCLVNEQATQKNIARVIDEFQDTCETGPDRLVLVYFACHGHRQRGFPMGAAYLLARDAKLGALPNRARIEGGYGRNRVRVNSGYVRIEDLVRLPGRPLVILLDACHSGGFHEEARTQMEEQAKREEHGQRREHGRAFITASASEEKAHESDGHGLFTLRLVEALCDVLRSRTDGVSAQGISDFVQRTVPLDADRSGKDQQPFAQFSGGPIILGRGTLECNEARLEKATSLPDSIRRRSLALLRMD